VVADELQYRQPLFAFLLEADFYTPAYKSPIGARADRTFLIVRAAVGPRPKRPTAGKLLGRLLGNLRSGPARLTQGNRHGLLPAFHLLPAAGFQSSLLVLLHDFVDLAFTLGAR